MKSIYKKYLTTVSLIWAGCFVLLGLVYVLVLLPQNKSRKYVEKQLAEKKQIYNYAQKAAQEETKIQLNEQIEHLRNRLTDFVADTRDLADLTLDISRIANEKRVDSLDLTSKDRRGGSEIPNCNYILENRFIASFDASGFNKFATFLNALERHRPVIFVDDFKITRSKRDDSGHKVQMGLAVFAKKQQDS